MNITSLALAIGFVVVAPFLGGILTGLDRILTARFQGRVGPPLLQPFYDLRKLFSRELAPVNPMQFPLIICHLVFMVLTGVFFFAGFDILLIIFLIALSEIFLILAAFCTGSPFSSIGAKRELLLMAAYEPMIIIALIGLFKVSGAYTIGGIFASKVPLYLYLPGIYIGFVFVMVMKLRKSPFDISTSHHAHQELVMGLTADMGGKMLGFAELAHWYEEVFLFTLAYLFFASNWVIGAVDIVLTWFIIILIDNVTARVKWQTTLGFSWISALVLGLGNLIPLYLGFSFGA